MRAIAHVRPRVGGVLVLAALAIPALLPAAAPAAAKPKQKKAKPAAALTSVGKPPRSAEAGESFRLAVKVRNSGKRAIRAQVSVRIHKSRGGKGDKIGSKRLGSLRPGRSATTRVTAELPSDLAAGRYYVSACVKAGGKSACRVASRRIEVERPGSGPGPNPGPGPGPNPGPKPEPARFDVLVLTETGVVSGEYRDSTPAGIEAIQALGKDKKFGVKVVDESAGHFTASNLKKYRAIIFLNVSGDVLTATEQSAFQQYYKAGGGFLAVHGAIEAEPNWAYMTDLLGTRADGAAAAVDTATIKVADRVHDASKTLPTRWTATDAFFNYEDNVRGASHVLATVDEKSYAGGKMGADHPVAWCKDYQGGRSFYTGIGGTAASYGTAEARKHLGGAIEWAAGKSNPVYSDCGATVLANYQQTKISAPPNVNEPIGFDQLPDGRIIQTVRDGRVRLHDPEAGTSKVIATLPVYTHSEDGLYGPAVDRNFAQNKWVYLFYSPLRMEGNDLEGNPYPKQTPPGAASTVPQADPDAWAEWKGYFQLSRFKFVDGENPTLDLGSEQKIMKVEMDRGACCHVAGDIDFDEHNNLWLVTGDDTPAGGGNSGGFGPFNDMRSNEIQSVRTFNATGGTFTLTFDGRTTAPIAYNATQADVVAALEALDNVDPGDIVPTAANGNAPAGFALAFRGDYLTVDVPQMTVDSSSLTGTTATPAISVSTVLQGAANAEEVQGVRVGANNAWVTGGTFTLSYDPDGAGPGGAQTTAPIAWDATPEDIEAALVALPAIGDGDVVVTGTGNVNVATVNVQFTGALSDTNVDQLTADASALTGAPRGYVWTSAAFGAYQPHWFDARRSSLNTNDLRGKVLRIKVGEDGSYTVPQGNLFPQGAAGTRPEIYAMGFRNPFRIQVDSDGVAYVTDYSPDQRVADGTALRGPRGTGRVEIVRKPANYGWPVCMKPDLPMFKWDFNAAATLGEPFECANPTQGPPNESRHNTGRIQTPPLTAPDMWYSFEDPTFGTPCFEGYNTATPKNCENLFPELGAGGVGPHGATKYEYDPKNPSTTKFPPYYDGAVFFGEFTRDTLKELRLDEDNKIYKINNLLDCGGLGSTNQFECDNPMDMQFGADGAFYLLTYGDGFFAANPDAGMYKWEYVKGQRAPQAVLTASVTSGQAPLEVQFSSAGTRDPDPQDSLTFAWDFNGDGTVDSSDPNGAYVYTQNGVYTAKLTVTDSSGKTDIKTTTITVGNTAPTVRVVTPLDGDFFEWGDTIPYSVEVTDPEDATIDCSRVQVTAVLIHDEHGHGGASATGCTGTLATNAEDASHGGYIATGISATYTDTGANGQPALSTTAQNVVQVRRQQVEYAQQQSGTTVANAGEADPGGGQIRNGLDDGDYIAINRNVNLTNMDKKITFRFANNATAGQVRTKVEVHLDSPTGPLAGEGNLVATGGNNTYTSQDIPVNFTGSRRVYLVFKAAAGGPTTNFGNLNWVEFTGPGVP